MRWKNYEGTDWEILEVTFKKGKQVTGVLCVTLAWVITYTWSLTYWFRKIW